MPFAPGQSGNKRGRPPKKRALTEILQKAGGRRVLHDDKLKARKQILAEMLWQVAMTGAVTFPATALEAARTVTLAGDDWFDAVKFIYAQIDGPPKPGIFDEIAEDRDIEIRFVKTEGRPATAPDSENDEVA